MWIKIDLWLIWKCSIPLGNQENKEVNGVKTDDEKAATVLANDGAGLRADARAAAVLAEDEAGLRADARAAAVIANEEAEEEDEEENVDESGDPKKPKKKKNKKKKKKSGSKQQTDPPSIPIKELFPNHIYPVGEYLEHPVSLNG